MSTDNGVCFPGGLPLTVCFLFSSPLTFPPSCCRGYGEGSSALKNRVSKKGNNMNSGVDLCARLVSDFGEINPADG